jgi:phosphoribosylformylglycinamidine (FGAM) synthase-like amidotransferase family enzyme
MYDSSYDLHFNGAIKCGAMHCYGASHGVLRVVIHFLDATALPLGICHALQELLLVDCLAYSVACLQMTRQSSRCLCHRSDFVVFYNKGFD